MSGLAVMGGAPVKPEIGSYAVWPRGTKKEEDSMKRVLHSESWGTLGPENDRFSKKYSDYCQSRFCLPVTNGTVSLELILRALNIGRGDDVIIPPYTFCATVSAVIMVGAMPVFVDIDPKTYTLDPERLEEAITGRTRAIIGVHLGGRPFDVDRIAAIAKKHNLPLIEDAAHAHGSEWNHKRAGSLADVASFSFQASKNLSSGEGGAITTDNEALYQKLWGLHHNGRAFGEYGYDHPYLGTNARLAEWQAALLCDGLERLDDDISRRMDNAAYLDVLLRRFSFLELMHRDDRITRNGLHLYSFKYKKEGLYGIPRKTFLRALNAENVCRADDGYSQPVYEMEMMYGDEFKRVTGRAFKNPKDLLPENEKAAYQEGAWFYHSTLLGTHADMDAIAEAVEKIFANADELRHL